LDAFLDIGHVLGHDRADGGAGGKEEIRNINFILVIFLRNGLTVLVGQGKVRYGMVFSDVSHRTVHKFGVYHRRLVDCQGFFGLQRIIEKVDDNRGEAKKYDSEDFVLGEKRTHTLFDKDTLVGCGVQVPADLMLLNVS
jgi:hypothetical protein